MKLFTFFVAIIALMGQSAQAQRITQNQIYPAVKISNTHQHLFHSKITNQPYELYVALPANYFSRDSTYPVLYLTDGNYNFGTMTEITRALQLGREMPETIIVGIGYPLDTQQTDTDRFRKWLALRMRDFTPTNNAQIDKEQGYGDIRSGGASAFLGFIQQELIPFIEKSYRTKTNNRTFVGYSLGGLFGLYTLFHHPELFQRYLIGSPSIWYDNKVINQHEKAYASHHTDLKAMVFMSAGSLEEEIQAGMVRNMLEMASLLKSRQYKQLQLRSSVLEGESHLSGTSSAYQKGVRSFFNPPK